MICSLASPGYAQQAKQGGVTGLVADATGALVRGASVRLRSEEAPDSVVATTSSADGQFSLSVAPGLYTLLVDAPGFATFASEVLRVKPGSVSRMSVQLVIATLEQQAFATDDATPGEFAGSLVFSGDRLRLLSDNNETLRQQLQALSGGIANFSIDGFLGGRLPPKSAIRSIRINGDPFSAYFADYGVGRVEIDTKPGTDHVHGSFDLSGTDQALDARNPYTEGQAPFYDFQQQASLSGPVGRRMSYFAAESVERLANSAVVNATSPADPGVLVSTTVPDPQKTETFSARLDRDFSQHNFGYVRDEWSQNHLANGGIAPLILPQSAFTSNVLTNTLQMADTQVVGAQTVNRIRAQYTRNRALQVPNSDLPSVVVGGAFQAGGTPTQSFTDNQDTYELQELFESQRGKHSLRAGGRFYALRDANRTAAGFNGQYIFSDVSSFLAGSASQYTQTAGDQNAVLLTTDFGIFAEDEFHVNSHLSLDFGLRFESQSGVPDHFDPAPRIGFSWAVQPRGAKSPVVTLSGGYGMFYNRFPAPQLLQSVRLNGTRELVYLAQNVKFNPAGSPEGLSLSATTPTIYRVDPHLRSSYLQVASLTAIRNLGRAGTLTGNVAIGQETHDPWTHNLNAPLPGTVDPDNPSTGVRPLGKLNLYQFTDDANGSFVRGYVLYQVQIGTRLLGFGTLQFDKHNNESDSIDSFPSNEYDRRQDYGRSTLQRAREFTGGFQYALPHGFELFPYVFVRSGLPFNITTGTDLNGDTIYNDRPGIATDPTHASVVRTGYGDLDTAPSAGQRLLPRDAGLAPAYAWVQLKVSKSWKLGPRPRAVQGGAQRDRPWNLQLGVEIQNLTNRNNPGVPVGILGASRCLPGSASCTCAEAQTAACPVQASPLFGHSLSLASDFSPVTASNRTVLLQSTFSW